MRNATRSRFRSRTKGQGRPLRSRKPVRSTEKKWIELGWTKPIQSRALFFYAPSGQGFLQMLQLGRKGRRRDLRTKNGKLVIHGGHRVSFRQVQRPSEVRERKLSGPLSKSINSELYALHEVVADWFPSTCTTVWRRVRLPLTYWTKERRFDLETADEFRIGYAPVDRFALGKYLRSKNSSRNSSKSRFVQQRSSAWGVRIPILRKTDDPDSRKNRACLRLYRP